MEDEIKKEPLGISRRDFLRGVSLGATEVVATRSLIEKGERFQKKLLKYSTRYKEELREKERQTVNCAHSPIATMTNLGTIPEGDNFHHTDVESLSCVIGRKLYSRDSDCPNHLDLNGHDNSETRQKYWLGVKEAISRGQKVFITIDLPGESEDDVTLDDWSLFMSDIGREFNGAYLIIGNEVNWSGRWKQNLDEYTDYYLASVNEIRKNGPNSHVLVYGDAYFENGEVLETVLEIIDSKLQKNDGVVSDKVDGLAFHFYDVASKLEERVLLYRKMCDKYDIDKLYLTELGRLESAELTEEQTSDLVVQNLATALYLAEEGLIENIIWHTAYAIEDPGKHSLTETNDKGQVERFRKGFAMYWRVCQSLKKSIGLLRKGDLTIVYGKDNEEKTTCIIWNHRQAGDFSDIQNVNVGLIKLPDNLGVLDISEYLSDLTQSNTRGVEGHPLIVPINISNQKSGEILRKRKL